MRALPAVAIALSLGCAHVTEAPADAPDAGSSSARLQEAAELGKKVAGYPMTPPTTRTQLVDETINGIKVRDTFRWLEDEKSPEVQAWMKAQNDYARGHIAELPGRDALIQRFTDLYYIDSVSAPWKRGSRYFFSRRSKTAEKSIVYWKQGEKGEEKVLLDPNSWSNDNTLSLGVWVPSEDGKKVVFAQKPNAADEATLYVLDIDSGERSKVDVIPGAKYASPSWTPDNKGFYYGWLPTDSKIPVSERPGYCEIRYHALGTDPAKDPVVREKTGDPKTFQSAQVSRDGKWLIASVSHGWNETDLYFKKLGKGGDKDWRTLVLGKDALYGVDVWKDVFYVTTDEGAPNKRVFKVDPTKPDRKNWKELIAEDKDRTIDGVAVVGGHLAVAGLRKVVSEVEVYDLNGKLKRKQTLPGIGSASNLMGNEDDDEAYLSFSSFVMPPQILKVSVKSGKSEVWAKIDVPVDPSPYVVEQVFYASNDGTQVPMFIVSRKDVTKDGNNPTLLYGYGGFDVSMTSSFSQGIYPWLEAGGVYAVANLRGGGEFGKKWHDAGKGANKQNVFDDFSSAAQYLIEKGYTSPKKLAIRGGSNGGLLVGAAMTQHPELYGAVICAVPLLDMVRYTLYGSGKTWISEYGDPEKADDFKVLAAYSPYHHVSDGTKYPPLLMDAADHDDRVDPMHARKFIARIQQATGGKSVAWLRIEPNAGHGGADQVKQAVARSADGMAFLFKALDVKVAGKVEPNPAPTAAPVGSGR